MKGDSLYPKDKFRHLLLTSGCYLPMNLMQFKDRALDFTGILNITWSRARQFTGLEFTKNLFQKNVFSFLTDLVHDRYLHRDLFESALLFNRETFK